MTIECSLLFGLSLLIDYLNVFSNNKHVTFKISFNDKLIKVLRNEYDEIYFKLLNDFVLEHIKDMENVILLPEEDYPYILPEDIASQLNVEMHSIKKNFIIPTSSVNYGKNYVVINTKVVTGLDIGIHEKWNYEVKEALFKMLDESDYDIFLIGEKQYTDCEEYRMHSTFSIYNDIMNANLKNIKDFTIQDTIQLYQKETIYRNFKILTNSNFNIHIGDGGGLKIFSYFNDAVMLSGNQLRMLNYYTNTFNTVQTFDSAHFLDSVRAKLVV